MRIRVADIVASTEGRLIAGTGEMVANGVSTDTRTLRAGQCFVALVGDRLDGHRFLDRAAEGGASVLVVSDANAAKGLADYAGAVVVVPDTLAALGRLARWYRGRLGGTVIGVTGSCGKTTVKGMTGRVLSGRLRGRWAERSFNNAIGVPLTLLASEPEDDYLVVELGTSGPGEMRHLAGIARPDVAVVTCVGPTHLAGLVSVEGVAREKEDLVRALSPDGVAVLNHDDLRVVAMAGATQAAVRTYGLEGGDVTATEVVAEGDGMRCTLDSGVPIHLPVPGRHNVLNALAAVAVARLLGVPDEEAAERLAGYRPPEGRLLRQRLPGGPTILDDCYNANPLAVAAALAVLCSGPAGGRRVLILGDMMELGDRSAELHQELGTAVARAGVNLLVTVGTETLATARGAEAVGDLATAHYADSEAAARELPGLLAPGDVVLVKGSRAMRMERVVEAIRQAYERPSAR